MQCLQILWRRRACRGSSQPPAKPPPWVQATRTAHRPHFSVLYPPASRAARSSAVSSLRPQPVVKLVAREVTTPLGERASEHNSVPIARGSKRHWRQHTGSPLRAIQRETNPDGRDRTRGWTRSRDTQRACFSRITAHPHKHVTHGARHDKLPASRLRRPPDLPQASGMGSGPSACEGCFATSVFFSPATFAPASARALTPALPAAIRAFAATSSCFASAHTSPTTTLVHFLYAKPTRFALDWPSRGLRFESALTSPTAGKAACRRSVRRRGGAMGCHGQ